jgi:hypothetical protein
MGKISTFEDIEDGLRFLFGNINSNLAHRVNRNRVESAWFESRAVRLEIIRTNTIQPRRPHLAPGTVMNTNKQHFLFHQSRSSAP